MKKIVLILLTVFFATAAGATPAAAQAKSDYLLNETKLPQKTMDMLPSKTLRQSGLERTANGNSSKKSKKKRTKKDRRADRHKRINQKKTEALFGTFNQ